MGWREKISQQGTSIPPDDGVLLAPSRRYHDASYLHNPPPK